MKILKIIFLLLICKFSFAQKLNKTQQRKAIYTILNEYYPEGKEIIIELANSPKKFKINGISITTFGKNDKPEKWVRGNSYEDVINSIGTIIHETIHGYTSQKALQLLCVSAPEDYNFDDYSAFYINAEKIVLVAHSEVYSSNELKKDIPKNLRTFRYKPYIEPRSKILGSQAEGIYGLLDEFNAYLQGARANQALLPYFKEKAENSPKAYQQYVQNISSSLSAFYEFKYFILSYLLRAENSYQKMHADFMNNQDLRNAYTAAHKEFMQLISTYEHELENMMKWANDKGIDAYIEDDYFWIGDYAVGMNTEDMKKLKPILASPRYQKAHNNFILN